MEIKNQAVIYCRVSTKEMADKGTSVKNQEGMCREYAKNNDIEISGVYKDKGISGKDIKHRDGIQEALYYVKENKNVKYFLVTETDRFARNSGEHYLVKEFLRKNDCKMIAVNQAYTQTEDETGDLVDGIMANINEFYSKFYGSKTRLHLQKKVDKGGLPRVAPIGYLNKNIGTKDKPNNVVAINDEKAYLVQEGFNLFSTGNYNCQEINTILYDKGLRSRRGKKLAKSVLIRMFHNPFYYGKILYKDTLYDGAHEPLIDKVLYDSCQQVLDNLNQGANRERKHGKIFF